MLSNAATAIVLVLLIFNFLLPTSHARVTFRDVLSPNISSKIETVSYFQHPEDYYQLNNCVLTQVLGANRTRNPKIPRCTPTPADPLPTFNPNNTYFDLAYDCTVAIYTFAEAELSGCQSVSEVCSLFKWD